MLVNMLSEDQRKRILEGYAKGLSITKIAEYAGAAESTVSDNLKRLGLEPHYKKRLSRKTIKKIQKYYRQGFSEEEAALKLGLHKEVVARYWGEPKRIRTSEVQIEKILEAHALGMTQEEAAAFAGVNPVTVRKYWNEYGLQPHYPQGRPISEEQKNKIIDAYSSGMTIKETAKHVGVSYETARRYLKNAGVVLPRGRRTLSEEEKNKIYEAHSLGMSLSKAAKYAGVSDDTVLRYWRSAGLKPHYEKKVSITEEQKIRIIEARNSGLTIHQIAELVGVNSGTVQKYLKEAGLTSPRKPSLTKEEANKIIEYYTSGVPAYEIANETERSTSTIYKCLKEHGIELRKKNNQKEN